METEPRAVSRHQIVINTKGYTGIFRFLLMNSVSLFMIFDTISELIYPVLRNVRCHHSV